MYDTTVQNGAYAYGTIAQYSCDHAHVLVGVNNRTCTGDGSSIGGSFDEDLPECQGILKIGYSGVMLV